MIRLDPFKEAADLRVADSDEMILTSPLEAGFGSSWRDRGDEVARKEACPALFAGSTFALPRASISLLY